jgi:hypothetical protein
MSRLSTTSSLLAAALGLTALGSTAIPAAALTGLGGTAHSPMSLGSTSKTSHTTIGTMSSPVFKPTVPGASSVAKTTIGNISSPVFKPTVTGAGSVAKTTIGNISSPVFKPTVPGTGSVAKTTVGNLQDPIHLPTPTGVVVKPNGGVDNICPFNKFKCPPPQNGTSTGTGTGTGTTAQNPPPGSNPSMPMPSGPMYPTGGAGQVVVQLPPAPVLVPVPSDVPPVAVPGPATTLNGNTTAHFAAPCTCLTKQYLDDGSVLFRDICTKEAAIETPAQRAAQAQTAAQ